jgi:DNA-binding transcriptional regulator YhcF (GntR family)
MAPSAQELGLWVDRESEVPVGTQLAWRLRALVQEGTLGPGDRLPSVRDLAITAGVNINTVRAVYARLEREGLIRSEQGRGTFVTEARAPDRGVPVEATRRQDLRRQIAILEAELARRLRAPGTPDTDLHGAPGARLQTSRELLTIRDRLVERLSELDAQRAEVLRRLAELEQVEAEAPTPEVSRPEPERRSSVSLRGARVRWVGA